MKDEVAFFLLIAGAFYSEWSFIERVSRASMRGGTGDSCPENRTNERMSCGSLSENGPLITPWKRGSFVSGREEYLKTVRRTLSECENLSPH